MPIIYTRKCAAFIFYLFILFGVFVVGFVLKRKLNKNSQWGEEEEKKEKNGKLWYWLIDRGVDRCY